jgi:glucose-6-phosphate-specific signal transduction histidine kinase
MRERVALVNGTLKVGPEAGHGWRVVVVIPLTPREQAAVIAPAPHEA